VRQSDILDLTGRDPAAFIPRWSDLDHQAEVAARSDLKLDRAGVDTWSFGWYVDPTSPPGRAMKALATERSKRSMLLPDPIAGHRVGWFMASGLIFAEGHPAGDGELGRSDQLPGSVSAVQEGLEDLGVAPLNDRQCRRGTAYKEDGSEVSSYHPGFAGVRRIDTTVDLRFDNALEGLATLCGMAQMTLPRTKKKVVQEVGGRRVETVYYLGYGGRSVLARCYDKGRETASAAPGAWVRPEDQRRFSREARPPLEVVSDAGYLRDQFVRRFEPLWRASRGVIVSGERQLAQRLRELVDEGAIKPSKAKALAGHIALDAAGVHEEIQGRSTVLGDRAECRDLGLVLATDIFEDVEIDLGEQLERAFDSEAWGPQG
jgi:hypothetical protein